jgi:hypothetical protein
LLETYAEVIPGIHPAHGKGGAMANPAPTQMRVDRSIQKYSVCIKLLIVWMMIYDRMASVKRPPAKGIAGTYRDEKFNQLERGSGRAI